MFFQGGDDVFMCKKNAAGAEVARYYNAYAYQRPVRESIDPLTDKKVSYNEYVNCSHNLRE